MPMQIDVVRGSSGQVKRIYHREFNATFDVPEATPQAAASDANTFFWGFVESLGTLLDAAWNVRSDHRLTPAGKYEKTETLFPPLLTRLSAFVGALAKFNEMTEAKERTLLHIIDLTTTNPSVAIQDVELRGWFCAMGQQERLAILSRAALATDDRYERLLLAILRAPEPEMMGEPERKIAMQTWGERSRRKNPNAAAEIEARRDAYAWAERGFALAIGLAKNVLEREGGQDAQGRPRWGRDGVLRAILQNDKSNEIRLAGLSAFGYDARDIARMEYLMEAQKRKAA